MQQAAELAWANPSSVHAAGRKSKRLLERAREQVAAAVGARPADIVFTSGGSEACCAGIEGLYGVMRRSRSEPQLVSSTIEHPAVRETLDSIAARHGAAVERVGPEVRELEVSAPTLLATQWINHETGIVLPVIGWAEQARSASGLSFIDASQALGKKAIDVDNSPFDALAIGGSKIGGPTGIGALWLRRGVDIDPLVRGGGQERARRGGTQNVVGAVGFGAACERVPELLSGVRAVGALRDELEQRLIAQVGARANGGEFERCETISNLWLEGIDAQRLVAALDVEGIMVSAGSACSAGIAEPSPVLSALYPSEPSRGSQSIRFSLGPSTRENDIKKAVSIVISVLSRFKA